MAGHIRKRGANYYIVLELTPDPITGKRRQKWISKDGAGNPLRTKKAAEKEQVRLANAVQSGTFTEPTRMTVRELLLKWLDHEKHRVGATTWDQADQVVRAHLIPELGDIPLLKLDALRIDEWINHSLERGRKKDRGPLSKGTVLNRFHVLRKALRQAYRWRLIPYNPAADVDPPKRTSTDEGEDDEAPAIAVSDSVQIFDAAKSTRLYMPLLIASATGMRRQEVLGLKWSRVDLDAGRLRVEEVLVQTREGVFFKPPKTKKSRRTVDLPAFLVAALRIHRGEQAKARIAAGPLWTDHDLVCPRPNGEPWKPNTFAAQFYSFVRRKGLPQVTFHGLRHTHISQLLAHGERIMAVAARVGHTRAGFMLDRYGHHIPRPGEHLGQSVDDLFKGPLSRLQPVPEGSTESDRLQTEGKQAS